MTREDALVEGTLTAGDLERLRKDFSANPVYRLAQNAVTRVTVDDVAINREIVSRIDHSVSTTLDDWQVTNQEQSGRCWLFAGLNLLRVGSDRGKDGFFTMNDSWFSQYVFEIAARKSALAADLQSALDAEPIVLPAWDPMGALAR